MNNYVLRKYAENIRFLTYKINITPSNYTDKTTVSKRWKVHFRYRQAGNPRVLQYNKAKVILNNQPILINRVKDHELKVQLIEMLQDAIKEELKNDPRFITKLIYGIDKAKELYPEIFGIAKEETINYKTIDFALSEAVTEKKGKISAEYYKQLGWTKDRFIKFLGNRKSHDVKSIDTKMISDFLSSIGKSNTTYNNQKANISSLLKVLNTWDYIPTNYANNIGKLKSNPKKNKAIPNHIRVKMVEDFKETPILYYYYLHIYYGLMRPSTIVRLQVKNIDLKQMTFDTDTKTGYYIKLIIPEINENVYSKIDLAKASKDDYIFCKKELLGEWEAIEKTKVRYYSDMFKPIKQKYNLGKDYTWTSFRHSAIGNMFENRLQELKELNEPNYIEKAIEFIRQITNHKNNDTTKMYLRDISTELHVDWSNYL